MIMVIFSYGDIHGVFTLCGSIDPIESAKLPSVNYVRQIQDGDMQDAWRQPKWRHFVVLHPRHTGHFVPVAILEGNIYDFRFVTIGSTVRQVMM